MPAATNGDWIAVDVSARLADALVHVRHELVEVPAQFRRKVRQLEEQIGQHRLAAADGPMDIEPTRHRTAATPEQRAKPWALRLPALQARQQVVEPPRDIELRGIRVDLLASDLRAQVRGHILRH